MDKKEIQEVMDDMSELMNNLEDDMKVDFKGENGYESYEEAYFAIMRYTKKLLDDKYYKWLAKQNDASKQESEVAA